MKRIRTVGERIKEYREMNELTLEEMSRLTDIKAQTLNRYELGQRDPKSENLVSIAEKLDVSLKWLSGYDVPYDTFTEPKHSLIPSSKKGVKIPVLGRVQAGIPIEAIEEVLDYEEITEAMARTGEFFGLQIKGDSMEPLLYEKDVIIVKKQPDAESGAIVVVIINGNDATVKKLKKVDNGLMLISINPKYEPMLFNEKDIEELPVEIIGKAVELRRKF